MTLLWVAALALLLLALGCIVLPLLAAKDAEQGEEPLRALHASRQAELRRDLQAAALAPADGALALEEARQMVLEDLQRAPAQWRSARWLRWAPAAALSVLVPLAAVVLYVLAGDPQAAAFQVWAERHEAAQLAAGAPAAGPIDAAGAPGIAGEVLLAADLQGQVQAGDTLFIVARAAEGGRMPVAVLRLQAGALPLRFVLDDSNAMSPDRPLSRFPVVSIEARISRSGNAIRAPGDLAGGVQEVALGRGDLRIVIDQVVR